MLEILHIATQRPVGHDHSAYKYRGAILLAVRYYSIYESAPYWKKKKKKKKKKK